jgi:thiamine pyrophosphokinase
MKAYDYAVKDSNSRYQMTSLGLLARCYCISNEFPKAIETYQKTGAKAIELGFESNEYYYSIQKEIALVYTNSWKFEKSLEIILENGGSEVVVYGGSGGEMDHYLGNLHVALKMKSKLKIYFVDEFSNYFFAEKTTMLNDVEGKMISLYPFPKAQKVKSLGLQWELDAEDLDLSSRIGIRNRALQHVVCIEYQSGELLIFQSHN